jgi:hypothetical protein
LGNGPPKMPAAERHITKIRCGGEPCEATLTEFQGKSIGQRRGRGGAIGPTKLKGRHDAQGRLCRCPLRDI